MNSLGDAVSGRAVLRGLATAMVLAIGCLGQSVLIAYPYPQGVIAHDMDSDGLRDIGTWVPSIGAARYISSRTSAILLQVQPSMPFTQFMTVTSMDDVDGDARPDVLVQARVSSTGPVHAQVVSGANGAILFTGPAQTPSSYVASLGDINGNGTGDFASGDLLATFNGVLEAGQVDVIDGGTWTTIRVHGGWFAQQHFGEVRGLGDVDGDGRGDYCVVSLGGFQGYSGGSGQLLFTMPLPSATFSEFLLPIGDFNADGFGDLVVNDRDSPPWSNAYRSVTVFGGPSGTLLWSHSYLVSSPGPVLFTRPTTNSVGDVDGDGYADVPLVDGTLGATNGIANTIVSGRDQSFLHEFPNATLGSLGSLIGSPGDWDDDGIPDLLCYQVLGTTPVGLHLISGEAPGVQSFGSGCPSATGAPPRIGISIGPRLGRTMSVNLSLAPSTTVAAVLGIGASDQVWSGLPLPLDLGPFGLPGCNWYVAPDLSLLLPTAGLNGTMQHASYPVPVPQNTQLLGLQLNCQWLVLDVSPGWLWASVSKAVRATVVP